MFSNVQQWNKAGFRGDPLGSWCAGRILDVHLGYASRCICGGMVLKVCFKPTHTVPSMPCNAHDAQGVELRVMSHVGGR
jgi:hypothetical protein